MNKNTSILTRFGVFAMFAMSLCGALIADDKELATADCQNDVRPIKRVRQPSKPVAVDWTVQPSTYTHDESGQRVDQYAAAVLPQVADRPDFQRGGFRSSRSSLQTGFSADHYHVTERWGQPVQPYGEWRYPNRPFSVPYGQWGPALPQVVAGGSLWSGGPWNAPIQGGPFPGPFPGGAINNGQGQFGVGPNNALRDSQDEYYQQAPFLRSN